MKFNDLSVGNFFTTYEQGKMLVGVKINAQDAINMATGEKIAMHFNRRVDAGKVTSLDLEKTTLARRQNEIMLASPTDDGRWLVHSFLITSTELCNAENLSFPANTGEDRESNSEFYIIIQQLLKNLTLAVNWAESAKECLKVT